MRRSLNSTANAGPILLMLGIVLFGLVFPGPLMAGRDGPESGSLTHADRILHSDDSTDFPIFVEINMTHRYDGSFDAWYGIYFFNFNNFNLDSVKRISMTGPSGTPVYEYTRGGDQNDFVKNQWTGFHVAVPGVEPAVGDYHFFVETDDFSTTVTHTRTVNSVLPIVDASTMTPADNSIVTSFMPVFEWSPVENTLMPVYYRLQLFDDTGYRIYATQRISNLDSLTLPEGVLEPDRTYTWAVYVYDQYDGNKVENCSSSRFFTFTTAEVLSAGRGSPPAIDWNHFGVFSHRLNYDLIVCWVDIIDHDGIAHNGSSHQVWVSYKGQTYPMYHVRSDAANKASYEFWAFSDIASSTGEYIFTVIDPEGNTASVPHTIAATTSLPVPDHNRFVVLPDTATPTITWDPVPGAVGYRVRVVDMNETIIWHGRPVTHPNPSYTVPPGVLKPDTDYQFRIRAWDRHYPVNLDNESVSEFVTFKTGDQPLSPFIEIDTYYAGTCSPGAATRSSAAGTSLVIQAKIYDAQGVPDNIESVIATHPNGTRIDLELESLESGTCGVYSAENMDLPIDAGEYTITVEDREGYTHSVTDFLTVNPIGYPADATINATVNGTRVNVAWEAVEDAVFYRLEIHDMDGQRLHNLCSVENRFVIPAGYLKENTAYEYRITTWREFFEHGVDNMSQSVMKTFHTGSNKDDSTPEILTFDNPDITITGGLSTVVYGTSTSNEITLESGAKAELINFPGSNLIILQSDATLFTISRSGTVVTFQGSDGTRLKIPATFEEQTIMFNDKGPLVLRIHENQVRLNDQVIGLSQAVIAD